MAGFFNLPPQLSKQIKLGEAIIRLSKSVNEDTPTSEWKKFKDSPHKWLHAKGEGYKYEGPGAVPGGEIPATVKLVPVYDTADTMHIVVPWEGVMANPPIIQDEPTYGEPNLPGRPNPRRFPVLLARYFMRQCR